MLALRSAIFRVRLDLFAMPYVEVRELNRSAHLHNQALNALSTSEANS